MLIGGIGGISLDISLDLIQGDDFDQVLLAGSDLGRDRQLIPEMGLAMRLSTY